MESKVKPLRRNHLRRLTIRLEKDKEVKQEISQYIQIYKIKNFQSR